MCSWKDSRSSPLNPETSTPHDHHSPRFPAHLIPMNESISVQQISKCYGSLAALTDVSLTVKPGERFGLIGPDGAGKTTLMRILCGLLKPDHGEFTIQGHHGIREVQTIKSIIGYMPQKFSLYPDLTVAENMQFFADLFGVIGNERKNRQDRLLKFSRLGSFIHRRASALSGGMKQKLALSCALIHTPHVLILDEPTTGVDPLSRREFWDILCELSDQDGASILVSTPYMDEALKCHRVAFLHHGRILATDDPAKIPDLYPNTIIEILSDDIPIHDIPIPKIPEIISVSPMGDRLRIAVREPQQSLKAIRDHLTQSGLDRAEVHMSAPRLEDVFIHLLGEIHDHV